MQFEGVRIICLNTGLFARGAAVALPGVGIVTGKSGAKDLALLRHEFGHILQYRTGGFFFFWLCIAPASLLSAGKALRDKKHIHMHSWTEWTANLLSFHYFNCPDDWDHVHFPVPDEGSRLKKAPRFFRKRIGFLTEIVNCTAGRSFSGLI